jgi:hypothetical protein
MKALRQAACISGLLLSVYLCFAENNEWNEVFSDVPADVSKWSGPEVDRISIGARGFVFSGSNSDPNIVVCTNQRFTGTGSFRISFSNLGFGTDYNNVTAYFIIGFANDPSDLALGIRLTRFGDGGELVFNNIRYDLINRPYLAEGKVTIQIQYEASTKRVLVQQYAGKYKRQDGSAVAGVTDEPVTLFDKCMEQPLELGTTGYPLMVAGESQHNGGYAGDEGATVSDITVETIP